MRLARASVVSFGSYGRKPNPSRPPLVRGGVSASPPIHDIEAQLTAPLTRGDRGGFRFCFALSATKNKSVFFCQRIHAELVQQRAVALNIGIARRQQLVAVEDGVRAGKEAQCLYCIGHLLPSGG